MNDDDEEPCECGAADCGEARAVFDKAVAALPKTVTLFYLSQGDQLMDEQVKEIFSGGYEGVVEHIDDWFRENDHYAVDYEIESLLSSEEIDCLNAHPSNVMPDHWTLHDELADRIRDRDDSDPFGELARATPDVMLRLDARVVINDGDSPDEIVNVLCRELKLSGQNRTRILDWIHNHYDEVWGDVEIIWRADVQDTINQFKPWEELTGGQIAVFHDPWIDVGGALLELAGRAAVPLTKVNDIPSVDNDICCDRQYANSPVVTTELELYRDDLLEFFNYRNRIMEGV